MGFRGRGGAHEVGGSLAMPKSGTMTMEESRRRHKRRRRASVAGGEKLKLRREVSERGRGRRGERERRARRSWC